MDKGIRELQNPRILCFINGNVAVFDGDKQVPELQMHGWLGAWLEKVEELGYNPEGWIIELPDSKHRAKVFRVSDPDLKWKFTWDIV